MMLLMSHSPSLLIMSCSAFITGLFTGFCSNSCQFLLLRYCVDVNQPTPPYLQSLHLSFGVGALIAPIIIAPFLQQQTEDSNSLNRGWNLIAALGIPSFLSMAAFTISQQYQFNSGDQAGYSQIGESQVEAVEEKEELSVSVSVSVSDSSQWLMFLLIGLFLCLYDGNETGYGCYIYSYAVVRLSMVEVSAAYLTSLYWGFFSLGRLLGILLSLKFSPQQMILADLIGCFIANLLILTNSHSSEMLWLGTLIYGLSVGSIYAAVLSFTQTMIGLNGSRLSYLTLFAAVGDAAIPFLIGSSFSSSMGSIAMMLIISAGTLLSAIVFGLVLYQVTQLQRPTITIEK